jgi:polar amino acid transport system substrate-binding protein
MGCGSSDDSGGRSASAASSGGTSTATSPGVDAKAAALVPAALRAKGTIVVATDASTAPFEFVGPDGRTVVGLDPDLASAIFPLLGLKAKVVNGSFDTIIPGLQSGKYDVGMSSFTDTKEREEVVNFVHYLNAGTQFFGKAEGAPAITSLESMCGLKVAVESGGAEKATAEEQSRKCVADGKPKVALSVFPSQASANLAVLSGRIQVAFLDSPVAAYQVKKSQGKFKLVGPVFENAPFGIAVPKASGTLSQAILLALKQLMADGRYASVMGRWGLKGSMIDAPSLNAATS